MKIPLQLRFTRSIASLTPHAERASELILGSDDGRFILESIISAVQGRRAAKTA